MKMNFSVKRVIDVYEWDEIVEATYGRRYAFQQQDGCKDRGTYSFSVPIEDPYDFENDSIPEQINGDEMGVSFKAWLERDPKQKVGGQSMFLDLFWHRNFYPCVDMLIEDLHKRGILEEGDYVIDIDW